MYLRTGGTLRAVSIYNEMTRTSLVVQWLGVSTFIAGGPGSIPGQGTKIPQAAQYGQKKKRRNGIVM